MTRIDPNLISSHANPRQDALPAAQLHSCGSENVAYRVTSVIYDSNNYENPEHDPTLDTFLLICGV